MSRTPNSPSPPARQRARSTSSRLPTPALLPQLAEALLRHRRQIALAAPGVVAQQRLRQLRDDPRTSEIPIIVTSAEATPGSIRRILANGANAYLTKPLDVHEVLEIVDAFLDRPGETATRPDPTEAVG